MLLVTHARATKLSVAVHAVLCAGAIIAAGSGAAYAHNLSAAQQQATQSASAKQSKPETLETVVVTGTHIRAVDLATSQPVTTVTAQQIQALGAETAADVLQQLPVTAGVQANPQYENAAGGGSGVSSISLRGLGASRTLVLVNGRRVLNQDLNTIPVDLISRVEVLKSGASSVYGSDAIGGVVNFILDDHFKGAKVTANYGISSHGDGIRDGGTFMVGEQGNKGGVVAGINYNKQNGILGKERSFSAVGSYLSNGKFILLGSSSTPTGRLFLPPDVLQGFGGCTSRSVTLAHGDGTSLGDYRCYNPSSDSFNFQAVSWILTPSSRTNLFVLSHYKLTNNIEAFGQFLYNDTHSNMTEAPDTFGVGGSASAPVVSQYNMYNPFGVDFSPNGALGLYRTTGIGPRENNFSTDTGEGVLGLRGSIGPWDWDTYYDYGRVTQRVASSGNGIASPALDQALGPSMLVNGKPTCVSTPGDPNTAIAGCVPINIFDQQNPAVAQTMAEFFPTLGFDTLRTERGWYADANGPIVHLPAGSVQAAVGVDFRHEYEHSVPSALTLVTNPAADTCLAGHGSACSFPLQGGFSVKEAYGELFIPILKDAPFVKDLSVDIGDRFSKYSLAGATNNAKIGVMWRPVSDLLVRATGSRVFRAPPVSDLFSAQSGIGNSNVTDPCIGLSASELAAHSGACPGVPVNWPGNGLKEIGGIETGSVAAGVDLKPEHGATLDYGFVYSPHQVPGLSVNADWWHVYLDDVISAPEPQTILTACFQNNSSPFCGTISRPNALTHELFFRLSSINLGQMNMEGLDFGIHYKLPDMAWLPGQWRLGLSGTYLQRADFSTAPGQVPVTHMAGKYNIAFGNYTRFRAIGTLDWSMGPWTAMIRERYFDKLSIGSADPSQNMTADFILPNFVEKVPQVFYTDVAANYHIAALRATLSAGINNAFNRGPPTEFTAKNAVNANTDIFTYDVIGRYYWVRTTFRF